jgi:hypothetical protein
MFLFLVLKPIENSEQNYMTLADFLKGLKVA